MSYIQTAEMRYKRGVTGVIKRDQGGSTTIRNGLYIEPLPLYRKFTDWWLGQVLRMSKEWLLYKILYANSKLKSTVGGATSEVVRGEPESALIGGHWSNARQECLEVLRSSDGSPTRIGQEEGDMNKIIFTSLSWVFATLLFF